ncbi:MAG: LPXTG cell wall anchor domain-containing protein [Acidimicrobiales bacterium]
MLKKILVLAAGLLLLGATAAGAQQYPPAGNTVTADDTTVAPGEPITLSAQKFQGSVTFTLFSAPVVLGTATANSAGVATITATIPSNTTPGTHRVEATGTGLDGQPLTVVLTITVTGAAGSGLPTTGSGSTTPLTQLAVAALAGGGLLVLLANRRRSARAEARETVGV